MIDRNCNCSVMGVLCSDPTLQPTTWYGRYRILTSLISKSKKVCSFNLDFDISVGFGVFGDRSQPPAFLFVSRSVAIGWTRFKSKQTPVPGRFGLQEEWSSPGLHPTILFGEDWWSPCPRRQTASSPSSPSSAIKQYLLTPFHNFHGHHDNNNNNINQAYSSASLHHFHHC